MTYTFYGQEVIEEDGYFWRTEIKKPIYGYCVALNEKLLREAIARNKILHVICKDKSEYIKPSEWISNGKRFEKVYRQPNNPMILYMKTIGRDETHEKQLSLF